MFLHRCLWVFLLPLASGNPPCDAEPFALDLTDVQVFPDVEGSFMRGIPATVGDPPQHIVLLPWPELNNTWIYDDQSFCDKTIIWNDLICKIRRGNLFQEEDSKSYLKESGIREAGGAPEEAAFQGSEHGIKKLVSTSLGAIDTLSLNGSEALEKYPIGIPRLRWDHGYTFLHSLGMGSNSTYLNALRSAGRIGSRVWSIFWGRMWIDEPLDGSVVIGGYDLEKVIGDNYTSALDYSDFDGTSGCWTGMKVLVRDIQLNYRDGEDRSIFPSNTALPLCIVPQRQFLFEAPTSIYDAFIEATGMKKKGDSFGLHWSAELVDPNNAFDGDLTFHLDSGLEIRVPNNQFLTPFVDINREGKRTVDKSKRELLINAVGGQPATLGRYFLTAAYLMVNHDSNTFTLWQANPSSSSNLVRVLDEQAASQCNDDQSVVQPSQRPSGTPSAAPEETQDSPEKNGPSNSSRPPAAIIGGAVGGGIGVLAILGIAVFFIVRRWKRRPGRANDVAPSNHLQGSSEEKIVDYKSGAGFNPYIPQEVPGSRPQAFEMQGEGMLYHELDARSSWHANRR